MTDNQTTELTATERLRAMLNERGVDFKVHDVLGNAAITWQGDVCSWFALDDEKGLAVAVYRDYLTPEQAIAATLGSEREKALEELVRDMWFWGYEGHMDSNSQDWQMKHIDGVLDRMKQLGIGVNDE